MELVNAFLPQEKGIDYQLQDIAPFRPNSHDKKTQRLYIPKEDGTFVEKFSLPDLIQLLTCLKPRTFVHDVRAQYISFNISFQSEKEIYIKYSRLTNLSEVTMREIPVFPGDDLQPKTYSRNVHGHEHDFILFPFCGKQDVSNWKTNPKKIIYSLPKETTSILSHLFRRSKNEFFAIPYNLGTFMINNFQWISFFKGLQDKVDNYIPSLKEQLDYSPGFVYIGTQNEIQEYKDYQFQLEGIPNDKSFCSFTYIVPEAISILQMAKNVRDALKHQYIHMQIDCSFKCTRPYVFSVPRVEMCHASIPLGVIVTPTEKGKTFDLFFQHLEDVIKKYNDKNTDNQLDFDFKRDVLFLSDQGSAEESFYQQNNLQHCWYTRHLAGSTGAFTPLTQIETEIFMIKSIEEWEQERSHFFSALQQILISYLQMPRTKKEEKQMNKIKKFAADIGLSSDLLNNNMPDQYQNLNNESIRYLPFLRDFSPSTDNFTEGPHSFFNDVDMHLTFEHRLVLLLQKVVFESSSKLWTGPISRWLNLFQNTTNTSEQCSCSTANYMQGVFGIKFCNHYCPKNCINQFYNITHLNQPFQKFYPEKDHEIILFDVDLIEPWKISSNYITLNIMKPLLKHKFKSITIVDNETIYMKMRNALIHFALKESIGKDQWKDICTITKCITLLLSPYFSAITINQTSKIFPINSYPVAFWNNVLNIGKKELSCKLSKNKLDQFKSYNQIYNDIYQTLQNNTQIALIGCGHPQIINVK